MTVSCTFQSPFNIAIKATFFTNVLILKKGIVVVVMQYIVIYDEE